MLKEYVPQQKYVLEANDKFFKGKAKIKTINMPIMKDSNAIYQGLQTGEYLTFTGTITPELIKTFSEKKDLKVLTGPGFSATMVYMNNRRPHFDNPEAQSREAAANGYDRVYRNLWVLRFLR